MINLFATFQKKFLCSNIDRRQRKLWSNLHCKERFNPHNYNMLWFSFILCWFKLSFFLFWGMVMNGNDFKTKKNKL